jgi:hypothetical protein
MSDVINLANKFNLFQELWNPKIVGELNDSYVKLAKLKGEFIWHKNFGSLQDFRSFIMPSPN